MEHIAYLGFPLKSPVFFEVFKREHWIWKVDDFEFEILDDDVCDLLLAAAIGTAD